MTERSASDVFERHLRLANEGRFEDGIAENFDPGCIVLTAGGSSPVSSNRARFRASVGSPLSATRSDRSLRSSSGRRLPAASSRALASPLRPIRTRASISTEACSTERTAETFRSRRPQVSVIAEGYIQHG